MSELREPTRLACAVSDIYVERFDITRDDSWYLGKLTEELGEVASAMLKARGKGRGESAPEALEQELADLFGFLLIFAAREGVDLDAALRKKWGQYLPPEEHQPHEPNA